MNCDFLVLGAGAMGLALAHELAPHGSVTVLANPQLRPASWAAAGILPTAAQIDAHDSYRQLVTLGGQLHADWAETLEERSGIAVEYVRCGGLHLARSAGEAAALAAAVAQWREEGVEVVEMEPDELARQEPQLIPHRCYQIPAEAQIRPPRFLKALRSVCEQQGTRFVESTTPAAEVRFERSGDRLISVRVGSQTISAGHFGFAAGVWTTRLFELLGIGLQVVPIRGQMALFAPSHIRLRHIINEGPNYIVGRRDGRILVGSTVEEVDFDCRTTDEGRAQLLALATDLIPALRDAPLEATWAGLRPRPGDGLPYLGKVPGIGNAFLATGHYRSGILLAPATAREVAKQVLGQPPAIDLTPFRVDRE